MANEGQRGVASPAGFERTRGSKFTHNARAAIDKAAARVNERICEILKEHNVTAIIDLEARLIGQQEWCRVLGVDDLGNLMTRESLVKIFPKKKSSGHSVKVSILGHLEFRKIGDK